MKPNIKQLSVTVAIWFATFFFTPAHAVVVDISGITVDDPVALVVGEDENLAPDFDIGFWFEMESLDINFPNDLRIELENDFQQVLYGLTGGDCGFPSGRLPGVYECDFFITVEEPTFSGEEWLITFSDVFADNGGDPEYRFLEGSFIAWGDDLHLINGTKVPTPGTLALLALGLAGLGFAGRKKA